MKTNDVRYVSLLAGLLAVHTDLRAGDEPKDFEKTFQVSPGGTLVIRADRGSILAATDSGEKVQVHVFREAKHASRKEAEELLADHEVTFKQEGNTISVSAREKRKRTGFWRGFQPWLEVRYEVTVPKKFNIDFQTAGGDVRLADLQGDARARTSSGKITFGKIDGLVEATDAGGDIAIEEAGGNLTAHTTSGSVSVQKAEGNAEITDAGGDIHVKEAGGQVSANTTSGRILIETVRGGVQAGDAGGDIRMESVGRDVDAHTTSGSIYLGLAKGGQVRLRDAGGDIEIHEAGGGVAAETTSGQISIRSVRGKVEAKDAGGNITIGEAGDDVAAQTTSGSVKITRVKGSLEVRDSGGDVRVDEVGGDATVQTTSGGIVIGLAKGKVDARDAGGEIKITQARGVVSALTTSGSIQVGFAATPKAECRLEVQGGGIEIALPGSAAVDLDARSAGGDVESDLAVAATTSGRPGSSELRGKVNGGGPLLTLRASSGNIRLKASSVVAVKAEDDGR